MYQALYRKYRPKNFNDVVGQDVVIQTLKNSITNNKINHAYLFAGPRGTGKTTIAKIFAKIVNCQNLNNFEPCNECVVCTQNDNQNMDIIEMDAASNNGVDEIREINNKVNLVPSLGKYKIYIIDEVHMLSIGAFNALLKTLEEPPAHVIFILATTDPHKVPITILSRCQRFDLRKINDDKIYERLKNICKQEKKEIEDDALKEISHLGDGSLRDAISVLDQTISYTNDKITLENVHEVNGSISQSDIKELMESLISGNLNDILNKIDSYNISGKSIVKITEEIIIFLRNIILFKTNNSLIKADDYQQLSNKISIEKFLNYIQIMNDCLFDMKKFINPKMLLELTFIKIMDMEGNFNDNQVLEKDKEVVIESDKEQLITNNFEKDTQEIKTKEEPLKNDIIEKVSNKDEQQSEELKPKFLDKTNINKIFNNLLELRLNNTLANFSKKETMKFKEKLVDVENYLMDTKFSIAATIIMDGELKAVSDEYAVFCFKSVHLASCFNENIVNIEQLLKMIYDKEYKVVAVDIEKWNIIKEEFNSKVKKFEYKKEEENIKNILDELNKTGSDDIKSMFGDLVEYS